MMTAKYALFTAIPLVGHINPLLRQAEELQRRGWRVAIASPGDIRGHVESEAPGLPFIDLGELGALAGALRKDQEAASNDKNFGRGATRIVLGLSTIQPLMFHGLCRAVKADRPDVMVVDFFSPVGLWIADTQGIPAVVNNPDLLACLPVTILPPADSTPFLFSGRSIRDIPWYQPLIAPFVRRLSGILADLVVGRKYNTVRKNLNLPSTSAHDLLKSRTILVNGVFGLEYPRSLPPHVEMIGPMLSARVPSLPEELAEWLAEGPPVVYVNLGTLVVAPEAQLAKMVQAFDTNRFRILWILKESQAARLPAVPGSVRVMEWGPMPLAVLAHRNVRAFVSHCGINSVHEAMATRTPMVGIPMFADQRDMAVRVTDAGAGMWLDKSRFTADDLRAAIERVLADSDFEHNAARIQALIAAAGGTKRAADVIAEAAAAPAGLRS